MTSVSLYYHYYYYCTNRYCHAYVYTFFKYTWYYISR